MSVRQLTRNTKTSSAAVAKRAAELVEQYLPDIIRRVVAVDNASSLQITIKVKPAGRTEAAKDPEVSITAKPDYGAEVVTFKARLTGEGDDAQLTLISAMVTEIDTDEPEEEATEEPRAATG